MTVRCASPTCTTWLSMPTRLSIREANEVMYRLGWRIQQQDGDDEERLYCKRCREGE